MTVETTIQGLWRHRVNSDCSKSIEIISSHFDGETISQLGESQEMKNDVWRPLVSSELFESRAGIGISGLFQNSLKLIAHISNCSNLLSSNCFGAHC
jgi:hypothetical protein